MNIGDKVRDVVTGFQGIMVGRSEFLNGCTRCGVQSDKLKDGLPTEAQWFDEPQLRLVKAGVVKVGQRDTGGPLPFVPKRAPDAKR